MHKNTPTMSSFTAVWGEMTPHKFIAHNQAIKRPWRVLSEAKPKLMRVMYPSCKCIDMLIGSVVHSGPAMECIYILKKFIDATFVSDTTKVRLEARGDNWKSRTAGVAFSRLGPKRRCSKRPRQRGCK